MFAVESRQHSDFFYSPSIPDRAFAHRSPSLSSSDTPPSPADDMDYHPGAYPYQRRLADSSFLLPPQSYNTSYVSGPAAPPSLFSHCPPPMAQWTTKLEPLADDHEQHRHHSHSRHSSYSHSSSSSPGIPMLPHHQLDSSPSPGPLTPPPSAPMPQAGVASAKTFSFISLAGNAVRKRPRRRYDEIERLYPCSWPNCNKSYGTLNHLNAHVTMQRHGEKRSPAEFKEMRKQWRKQKKDESSFSPMSPIDSSAPRSLSTGGSRRSLRGIGEDHGLASPVSLSSYSGTDVDHDSTPSPYSMHHPQMDDMPINIGGSPHGLGAAHGQALRISDGRRMSLPNLNVSLPEMQPGLRFQAQSHILLSQPPALPTLNEYWPSQQSGMYSLPPLQTQPLSAPPQTTHFSGVHMLEHASPPHSHGMSPPHAPSHHSLRSSPDLEDRSEGSASAAASVRGD